MLVVEIIFFGSLAAVVYAYAGYPVLVALLARVVGRPVRQSDATPRLSVVVAARNEERDIAAKLENTLGLDYPRDAIEIVVVSDGSTDRTDEIVRAFEPRGVRLVRQEPRLGKTAAQNLAVRHAAGEIVVFSDATTRYEPDALRKIVRPFADPTVGCVAGQLVYVDGDAETAVGRGCRSYWSYEKLIKGAESRLFSLIGVSGCLYAVRRASYRPIDDDMSSDFVIASEIYDRGLRTVYDPEAVAIESTNSRGGDEFRMRVRVIEQTYGALWRYRRLLNPLRHPVFAFEMISHKVMRYAVPLFLLLALAANAALVGSGDLYRVALAAQVAFYVIALGVWPLERRGLAMGPLALPYYFVLANAASVAAMVKFVRGEGHVTWEPVRGRSEGATR